MKVNLIKGDKLAANTDYRDALPVNMYAVVKEVLGASGYMSPYSGITQFCDGIGADRGGIYNERQGGHFRVSGGKLISISSAGVVTEIGDIPGSTQASLPYSFNTQAIIADGKMYLYSSATGLDQITDADIGVPIDGIWIDGYYFLTDGESLYHTVLTDETSINPLSYDAAEFMPDPVLGLGKTPDNKVIVFGRYSAEYFSNVATANFAFRRDQARAQKVGIVATHAKCEVADLWYITGGRKEEGIGVHALGTSGSVKISTREIDKILAAYNEPDLSDMRMEGRKDENNTFVIIHLPSETLCFNRGIADQVGLEFAWTILKTGVQSGFYYGINCVFDPRNGKFILGSRSDEHIGHLDNTVFSQLGDEQEFIIYTPFVKLESLSIDKITLETIPGRNTIDDATLFISRSERGDIFGKEFSMSYGEPKDYQKQFILWRAGYVNSWVGLKFRGVTKSRMSFAALEITAT